MQLVATKIQMTVIKHDLQNHQRAQVTVCKITYNTPPKSIKALFVDDWFRLRRLPCACARAVCVMCPEITKHTQILISNILIAYKYNVRPQGRQVREHRCRQLLQLVSVKPQYAVAKKKSEKINSTCK
jgi:hypothetical protein